MFKVPIARSDVHIHLNRADVDTLFGKNHQLTNIRNLTIPGQFACSETVSITGPDGTIDGVVVVGPERPYTQVEISVTNGLRLGIKAPVRMSGDLENTPGVIVTGPKGTLHLDRGIIVAARHVHMHSTDAAKLGLKSGDIVSVKIPGERGLVFNEVRIKCGPDEALEMHVDFDEGHAAGIIDFQEVELLI